VIRIQCTHIILESGCQYVLGILDFPYYERNYALCDSHVHSSFCLLTCEVLLAPKLIDLFTVQYSLKLNDGILAYNEVHLTYRVLCGTLYGTYLTVFLGGGEWECIWAYGSLAKAFTSLGWYVV
jgi:hypothetical protein